MNGDLERQIDDTRRALEGLRRQTGEEETEALLEALEVLSATLEELEVTSEELQQQNEELRATQDELASERRAYRDLFHRAPVPYLATDSESNVLEANRAAADLLGVSPRRLQGRVLALFVPEEARAAFRRRLLTLAAGEPADRWEFPVQPRTGPVLMATTEVLPVHDRDGEVVALRWVLRDVTDARQAQQALQEAFVETAEEYEQLREVDRWKDAFLAAAAHDLRSPLSVIATGAATLVEHPELEADDVHMLAVRIDRQAKRLAELLDDLLDLDRFTRGAVTAERRPTEVRALAERVVAEVDLEGHPVEVVGPGVTAELDAPRVAQIVQNLVLNAVKHTPPGTPMRVIVDGDADCVTMTVEDEGPGVPAHVRDDLLLPFVTAASHDADRGGTGIGLSLVELFAQLHGGGVRVEDRPGGGARFVVELPGPATD